MPQLRDRPSPFSQHFLVAVACALILSLVNAAGGLAQSTEESSGQAAGAGQSVVLAINQARANAGLPALAVNPLLNQAAQAHVDDMVANYIYGHWGSDGSFVDQRVARTGYSSSPWVSENWVSALTPEGAMNWWMNDYVHRVNILNGNWSELGVGVGVRPASGEMVFVTVFSAGIGAQAASVAPVVANTAAVSPAPEEIPAGGMDHTVGPGDTLLAIGLRYGVAWELIAAANGLGEHSVLQIGQAIHLPGSAPEAPAAEPEVPGMDDATAVALMAAPYHEYTVEAGDTLFSIAPRSGLTWQELATANGLGEHDLLNIGQVVRIPELLDNTDISVGASAPQEPAAVEPAPSITEQTNSTHVVASGDTIFSIALRYSLEGQDLLALNGLNESSILQLGQSIRLK